MHLTIIKITQETPNMKSLRFERPTNFNFIAGQFIIIIRNPEVRRAFSISSSPTIKDYFEITFKLFEKGAISPWLYELKEGDTIELIGPYGVFHLFEGEQDVVFIGGGSGITPFRAITQYATETGLKNNITLFYGARTPDDLCFKQTFDQLAKKNQRFKTHYSAEKADANWKGSLGFITKELLQKNLGDMSNYSYYVVGPQGMIMHMSKILNDAGITEERIHLDNWN